MKHIAIVAAPIDQAGTATVSPRRYDGRAPFALARTAMASKPPAPNVGRT